MQDDLHPERQILPGQIDLAPKVTRSYRYLLILKTP